MEGATSHREDGKGTTTRRSRTRGGRKKSKRAVRPARECMQGTRLPRSSGLGCRCHARHGAGTSRDTGHVHRKKKPFAGQPFWRREQGGREPDTGGVEAPFRRTKLSRISGQWVLPCRARDGAGTMKDTGAESSHCAHVHGKSLWRHSLQSSGHSTEERPRQQ